MSLDTQRPIHPQGRGRGADPVEPDSPKRDVSLPVVLTFVSMLLFVLNPLHFQGDPRGPVNYLWIHSSLDPLLQPESKGTKTTWLTWYDPLLA